MTKIISAAFGHSGNARLAESILRDHGYRVTLTHPATKNAVYPGICPGSERYSPAVRSCIVPERDRSILTVLTTGDQDRVFVLDTIRRHSGMTIL